MGVTGLWRLIEPSGKPVPVETLENKVLAVDISIWLHQMVKGYQDAKGAPLPNAHLMGLFQRLCKLLYFRIKPVFVFDGGFPDLKKETIAKRQDNKAKYNSESERIKRELALLLSKKTAISSLLGKDISPKTAPNANTANNDDLFKLPALPEPEQESESESEEEGSSNSSIADLHSVDIESNTFKSMPVKDKYDLLIELKETRKMNSWGKINQLPKKSDNFSDFQMQRLLKRRKVQECLEETEKEMGDGGMSLNELESLLNDTGIDTQVEVLPTRRIASNNNTRYLLINDVKQALLEAKKKKDIAGTGAVIEEIDEKEVKPAIKKYLEEESEEDLEKAIQMSLEFVDKQDNCPGTSKATETKLSKKDEFEEDLEKAIKMSLECVEDHNTSNYSSKTDESWTSFMSESDSYNTDSEEEDGFEQTDNMSSAKAYIMQYSDFTDKAIKKIMSSKHLGQKNKLKKIEVDDILKKINREESIIADRVELSSDEDTSIVDERTSGTVNPIESADKTNDHEPESFVPELSQTSVLFIENTAPSIMSLETSIKEAVSNNLSECSLKQRNNKTIMSREDKSESNTLKDNLVKIEMHSSEDEFEDVPDEKSITMTVIESDSSTDEFEDVPEVDSQKAKAVVQLTLDLKPSEDDIFADCFLDKEIGNSDVKIDLPQNIVTDTENQKHTEKEILKSHTKTDSDDALYVKNVSRISKINEDESNTALKEITQKGPVQKEIAMQNVKDLLTEQKNYRSLNNQDTPMNQASKKKDVESESKKKTTPVKEVISIEKLNEMAEKMANEEENLVQEKGRLDRVGRNITEQMTKEAQELLQMFGVPYIVAPMEAEAQCAFLENVNLTDGTITDDSDIWLFGGKTVYKNFFNQKKHVLQFLSERIEKSFNLTREQLILLALLVGSDYTTGVDGVGPVTAMEILASFPFNKKQFLNETSKQSRYQHVVTGMQEFKRWVRAGKRTDNTTLKKKLRNVTVNDDFPSVRVVQAYLEPNVEKSEDKFSWGEIDITILRDYTKTKFGWSQNKLDEIMNPVLKRLQERKSQKTLQDYFKRKVDFQSLEHQMSKRVKAAVQKMGPEQLLEQGLNDCEEPNVSEELNKPSRKRKVNTDISKMKRAMAGPSKRSKNNMTSETDNLNVRVVTHVDSTATGINIIIPKTDRFQEIIPQREKDKQCLLQNKMKAIEVFRKSTIDKKKKVTKKKVILPKEKAELSESSDGD